MRRQRGRRHNRLLLERLEDRTLLSINYPDLGARLNTLAGTISTNLDTYFTQTATDSVPFIGLHQPQDFSYIANNLQTIGNALKGTQDSGTNNPTEDIQAQLSAQMLLGNGQLVTSALAQSSNDVPGIPNSTVDVQLVVHLATGTNLGTLQLDLSGLGNFLSLQSTPNVQVNGGFDFNLDFHYDPSASPPLTFVPPMTPPGGVQPVQPLMVNVVANLSDAFTGKLNKLLFATVSNENGSRFVGHFGVNLDPLGNVQNVALTTDSLDTADGQSSQMILQPQVNLQFGDPGQVHLPFNLKLGGQLYVQWVFGPARDDNSHPGGDDLTEAGDFGEVTSAKLTGLNLDVTSLLGGGTDPLAGSGILDSAIKRIRDFTLPFKPIASLLGTEIPGLSSLGFHLSLANLFSSFGVPDLVNFINTANSFSPGESIGPPQIGCGDFGFVAPSGTLLDALQSGKLGVNDLTPQVNIKGNADSATNSLVSMVEGLTQGKQGDDFYTQVKVPLVDDSGSLMKLLKGDDTAQLFTFQFSLSINPPPIKGPPIPIAFLYVVPIFGLNFTLGLSMGYDATGLNTAAYQDAGNSGNWTQDLLAGFYFDTTQTGLSLQPSFTIAADAVLAQVSATIGGDLTFGLSPDGDGTNRRHFDQTFFNTLQTDPDCLFEISGDLTLQFSIKVGFFPPVGPDIVVADISPPAFTLFSFSAQCGPGMPNPGNTLVVYENSENGITTDGNDHTILIHNYYAADPAHPGGHIGGVEVDFDHEVQRYETTAYAPDGTASQIAEIQQVLVYPLNEGYNPDGTPIITTGKYTVIMGNTGAQETQFGTTVIGGVNNGNQGNWVNALMIGGDGGTDDFEYYGNASAVLVGGKGSNRLVGGVLEFGGGLPQSIYNNVQQSPANTSDFPQWIQDNVGLQLIGHSGGFAPILGNPLQNAPGLQTQDGADSISGNGAGSADVLYGGSTTNVFVGDGAGNIMIGNPVTVSGVPATPDNTFLVSAMLGYPAGDSGPDTNLDQIFGSVGGKNLLQFTGFIDGSHTDNISLQTELFLNQPAGVHVADTLPDGSAKQVQASGITQVLIDAGTGAISVGDLSESLVSQTDINFELQPDILLDPFAPPNSVTVNTATTTGGGSDIWNIQEVLLPMNQPMGSPGISLGYDNQGVINIEHLLNDQGPAPLNIGTVGQLILDDTARINTGVGGGGTFNVASLPANGPDLTINLGAGSDIVNVPNVDLDLGHTVTVNGGSATYGGFDTLLVESAAYSQTWDVEQTSVSLTTALKTVGVSYSGLDELEIGNPPPGGTFTLVSVYIAQQSKTLNGLPRFITLPDELFGLGIHDENTTNAATWKVQASEVDRITNTTLTIQHGLVDSLYIDGGVGGSTFYLSPKGIEQGSGGRLGDLSVTLMITGHGTNDSIIADDENTLPYSDRMIAGATKWTIDGLIGGGQVTRSFIAGTNALGPFYQDDGFNYFNIQNLQLIGSAQTDSQGNPVANTFILSSAHGNLDEMPSVVSVNNAADLLLNDQNSQAKDLFGLAVTTTWQITGGNIVRSYPTDFPILGPVTRTINFDAPTVTVNGGMNGNHFVITPNSVGNPLPDSLTLNGGPGGDSLLADETAPANWTVDQGSLHRTVPSEPGSLWNITFANVPTIEIDASLPIAFTVRGTAAGTTTTLVGAAAGNNSFLIGDSAYIQGSLVLHGNGAGNTLARVPDFFEYPLPRPFSPATRAITAGPDGAVWFSQPDNNTISRITTTGQVTDYGGVADVTNLAAGPDGNMWFLAGGATDKIFQFNVQNQMISGYLTPLGDQPGVVVGNLVSGPGPYLWFTVYYLGYYIGRLDPTSGAVNLYQAQIGNETPTGLTVAADGSLRFGYFLNSVAPVLNYIATITAQGIETDTLIQNKLGNLGTYAGLTVDQNNNFWMTSYISRKLRKYTLTQGLLSEIDPAGVVTRRVELSAPQFPHFNLDDMSKPGQIILGSDGALWFANVSSTVTDPSSPGNQEYAGDIGRFDPVTGVLADLTPPTTDFVGNENLTFALTSGPDGNIWFTEPDQDLIGKVAVPKGSGTWQINGPDKGELYSNVTFDSVQNLAGGLGGDTFSFVTGGSLSGAITGGLPTATLDFSQDSDPVSLGPTMPGTLHGRKGTATPVIGNGFDNIDVIVSHAAAGLKIDDTANSMPTTWTITASSVTRQVQGQPASTINYSNVTSVEIDSGPGANTFIVLATATGIPLTIDGLGNDTVHIGNPTDGVGDILGAITVTGIPPAGRYTDLVVDDSAYNRGYWFATLSESSITTTLRTDGGNQVQVAPINYTQADLSSLTVLLGGSPGPSGNLVSIANTPTSAVPGGLMTTIDTGTPTGGAGADQVFVGVTTGPLTVNLKGGYGQEGVSVGAFTRTLDAIRGAVTINGLSGSGTNLAVYDDGNTAGEHYVVTNNTVVGRPGLPVITYHLTNELALYASSGVNTIDVKNTSVATVLVAGLSGQDVVNVGDKLNTLNGVTGGYLDFQMVNPGNRVNLNDQGDPNNHSYDFALFGGYLPGLIRTDSAGNTLTELFYTGPLQALSLRGSAGSDTYNVQYIQAPVFIHDHAGDVVNVGNAGSVQGILAPLSVDAGSTMVVDDSADPTPRTFQVSPASITGLAPAPINYGPGVADLTIDGGYGGNLIGVLNTNAKTSTTVNSGNGVDTVYVFATTGPLAVNTQQGGTAPGFQGFESVLVGGPVGKPATLDTIRGPLSINTLGRPNVDFASVAFFDTAATTPETYTITSNTVLRSGAAPITYRVTNDLEFRLGSGGNLVNIQSTFPGLPDLFVGGLGNDTFLVGDSSNTLNGIQSHLSFQIANPGSRVILHDEGDSANVSFTVAQDPNISPSNFVKRSNSGYYIFYSGPLKTLRLDAGGGNDSFAIRTQPPSSTTVTLVGGTGSNSLQGPDQTNSWQVTGANAGKLNANVAFANVQNLVGGAGNDAFAFKNGGSIAGTIDGAGGVNAFDYSGYTGDVTVDLPLGSASLVNHLAAGSIFNIQNVTGSRGNDLLVGDANANVLVGGTGRNILIGGAGADQLFGGNGDDILIGGTTDYDSNLPALIDFMTEWLRTDLDFGQRVADIFSGGAMIPDGKPPSILLGTGFQLDGQTVHSDQAANILTGSKGNGHNWFFWDPAVDTLQKKKPGDILISI